MTANPPPEYTDQEAPVTHPAPRRRDHAQPLPYPPHDDVAHLLDTYRLLDPDGGWGYDLDDTGVVYGDGAWPFYRDGAPSMLRLAPDIAYYAWRDHYVLAGPIDDDIAWAAVTCQLPRPGKQPEASRGIEVRFSLTTGTISLAAQLPAALQEQAVGKVRRVQALLAAASADRAQHQRPVSAYDRYLAQHNPPPAADS